MRRLFLGLLPALALGAAPLFATVPAQAFTCGTVPVGQANPSSEVEPLQPVWCLGAMAAEPTTRVLDQWGGWQDAFQTNVQDGHLNNGDMGYRVFDGLSNGDAIKARHFVNNNHWMLDMSHDNGGAALSPNQAFHFENGKLILEADVAAGIPGYFSPQGDIVWPEIDWSTSPTPTAKVADGLYLYGHFGGAWTAGCRLNGGRNLICAMESNQDLATTTNDKPPCFSTGARVFELSGFQQCGTTHAGFATDFGAPKNAWRQCQANQMDMYCRDRFRLEWSKDGFVAYVNGIEYAQDTGWPGYAQIPENIVDGQTPVYAFFGEWGDFTDTNVYRFHWGRLAVNPHDANGSLLGLSAAPSYCPSQPLSTCPMSMQSSSAAMPQSVPTAAPARSMPAMAPGASIAHEQTHLFIASALNGGQQPMFWIVLGVMVAGGAAVGVVMWLWLAGPRRTSS
jgi:hypothetical protein